MKKHGPLPGNLPNPYFVGQVQTRRRREKIAKKSRQVNYRRAK